MHHYRNDETDVFFHNGVPTLAKSERPHIIIDQTTGVQWINLGGTPSGAAATFYRGSGVVGSGSETITGATRAATPAIGKRAIPFRCAHCE